MTTKKLLLFAVCFIANLYHSFAQGTTVQPATVVKYQMVVSYPAKTSLSNIQSFVKQLNGSVLDFDDRTLCALISLTPIKINNEDFLGYGSAANPKSLVKASTLMKDCMPYATVAQGVPAGGSGGNVQSQGDGWNYSWSNNFGGGPSSAWTSAVEAAFYEQFAASSFAQGNCSIQVAIDDSGYNNGVVTGVQPTPFGNMLTGTSKNYINLAANPIDSFGHGTFVTGIATGVVRAVSRTGTKVKIVPYKILDKNGAGSFWQLIKSLSDLSASTANIINLSVRTILPCEIKAKDKHPLIVALNLLKSKNKLLVCASGNDGLDIGAAGLYYVYPAALSTAYPNTMLCVGSVSATKTRSTFSNYGAPVQLYTAGENITSTLPGIKKGVANGTSFAAPQVAGVAALFGTYQLEKGKCAFNPGAITSGLTKYGDSFTGNQGKILNAALAFQKLISSLPSSAGERSSIDTNFDSENTNNNLSLNAFPNPFNEEIAIKVNLPKDCAMANLSLIDAQGRLMQQQQVNQGIENENIWFAQNIPVGLYFIKIETPEGQIQSLKVMKM
jgi:hypothetical protein